MMKVLCIAAIAAVAYGQSPEISTAADGSLVVNVNRRQSVDVASLEDQVSQLTAAVASMSVSMSNGIAGASLNLESEAVSRAIDNAGRLASIETSVSMMSQSVTDSLAAAQAGINSQLAAADSAAESRATVLEDYVNEFESSMEAALENITRSTDVQVQALNATLARTGAALSAQVESGQGLKIWSGGCSSHPGSGWRWYCLNRQLYNNAAAYLVKHDNYYFRATRPGFFRLNFFTICQGSGWVHIQIELNGQTTYYSYMHVYHCWWKDMQADQTFQAAVNNRWRLRTYVNCGHAFHNGGAATGGSGYHSRITSEFAGAL
jgi:hypothetical protein